MFGPGGGLGHLQGLGMKMDRVGPRWAQTELKRTTKPEPEPELRHVQSTNLLPCGSWIWTLKCQPLSSLPFPHFSLLPNLNLLSEGGREYHQHLTCKDATGYWLLKGLFFSLVSGLFFIQAKPMDQWSTKLNWHKPTKSPYREDFQIVQDFPITVVAKILRN